MKNSDEIRKASREMFSKVIEHDDVVKHAMKKTVEGCYKNHKGFKERSVLDLRIEQIKGHTNA
jgi:hypothetical protein